MTMNTEALRAKFEKYVNPAGDMKMHPAAWLSITQDGANRLWNSQPRLLQPGELIYQLYTADQLVAAVADAVAAERERCAQVCDRVALAWDGEEAPDGGGVAKQCSDAIRAGDGEASND